MALLKAHRPLRRERSVRFQMPALQSAADAPTAMASIAAAVATGAITPSEAAELSKLVETFIQSIEAREFDRRLQLIEAKRNAKRS